METLLQDLHYGIRVLLKKPGFAVVAILTLAIGIGANTAIFSVVNGVLLRPLLYRDAESIYTLWQNNFKNGVERDDVSPANFLDWQAQNQVFEKMAACEPYSHDLSGQGEPESLSSWLVSEDFFQILGVSALHGRTFHPEEHQAGNNRVIVLGYNLWRRKFGGDPNLVGQKLMLRNQPYTVIGIMPPEFLFPLEAKRESWAPRVVTEADRQRRGSAYLKVIGRLKPGVTLNQASDDMKAIASRLAEEYPQANREVGATVVPLAEHLLGHVRPALLVLLGAVGFVLLIACANVANLLLVRGAERQREFAIRSALGAARLRLVRQMFTESIVLALAGGFGGILLAWWVTDLILALSPGNLPRMGDIGIDVRVLGFALGVSVLTALVSGLLPSLQFSKPDLNQTLKDGGRGGTAGFARLRVRNILVVSEIALALVLLMSAGLLVRSFARLLQVDPGFAQDKVIALEVHVWSRYRTPQQQAVFFDETTQRIRALPGVEAAGAVSALPFHENSIDIDGSFTIEGNPAPAPGQEPLAYQTIVTPEYFKALGIPILRGRFFTRFDNKETAAVALINETMARRYFAGEEPVGKRITQRFRGEAITSEIIGIVGDVRHTGLDSSPRPEMFMPHLQTPYGSMTYVVRTASDPATLVAAVKNEVWAVSKDQPFSSVSTIEQLVSRTLAERRFNLLLLGSFALIALVLASVGIYGLMSFSTSQRTHEIGIRMALGASHREVLRLVFREGVALTAMGLAIGWLAAFALTRILSSMLFGVSAMDPLTFIAVSTILATVALIACYIPARRATKVDPMVALRYE
jgi:putative ABC transport system permease protein